MLRQIKRDRVLSVSRHCDRFTHRRSCPARALAVIVYNDRHIKRCRFSRRSYYHFHRRTCSARRHNRYRRAACCDRRHFSDRVYRSDILIRRCKAQRIARCRRCIHCQIHISAIRNRYIRSVFIRRFFQHCQRFCTVRFLLCRYFNRQRCLHTAVFQRIRRDRRHACASAANDSSRYRRHIVIRGRPQHDIMHRVFVHRRFHCCLFVDTELQRRFTQCNARCSRYLGRCIIIAVIPCIKSSVRFLVHAPQHCFPCIYKFFRGTKILSFKNRKRKR